MFNWGLGKKKKKKKKLSTNGAIAITKLMREGTWREEGGQGLQIIDDIKRLIIDQIRTGPVSFIPTAVSIVARGYAEAVFGLKLQQQQRKTRLSYFRASLDELDFYSMDPARQKLVITALFSECGRRFGLRPFVQFFFTVLLFLNRQARPFNAVFDMSTVTTAAIESLTSEAPNAVEEISEAVLLLSRVIDCFGIEACIQNKLSKFIQRLSGEDLKFVAELKPFLVRTDNYQAHRRITELLETGFPRLLDASHTSLFTAPEC